MGGVFSGMGVATSRTRVSSCVNARRRYSFSSSHTGKPRLMKTKYLSVIAVGIFAIANAAICAEEPKYHLAKEIAVGGEGGWDCLSVDEAGRRLYVTHGNKVVVVDVDKDEVVGEITDTPGVHGFAVAHELGRGFSSNG